MPELPEVETVCRGLDPVLTGARLKTVLQRRPDLRFPLPPGFTAALEGRVVTAMRRRAKYILADLDDGRTLIVHLGMSGRMLVSDRMPDRFETHDHVVLETAAGPTVRFNDARRFGMMDLWPTDRLESHPWLASLGPEPLSNGFSGPGLAAALAGKRTPIKAALLDQRVVAGLGNIYVCEALHMARISPRRLARSVQAGRAERLAGAVRAVLTRAIAAGGSSLRDYRRADGELGYFQHSFAVYGREGGACRTPACDGSIRRIVQSGRSTFFCSRCQR